MSSSQLSTVPVDGAVSSNESTIKPNQKSNQKIIYAIVENQRGVLHRVSSMFRAKGFNITSISIGRTFHPDLARMTIVPSGDDASLNLLVKQLRKMIDVIEVGTMSAEDSISRELALVKFVTKEPKQKREILEISDELGGKTLDSRGDSLVIELCSTPEKIDSFVATTCKVGTQVEVVRTGVSAIKRD